MLTKTIMLKLSLCEVSFVGITRVPIQCSNLDAAAPVMLSNLFEPTSA